MPVQMHELMETCKTIHSRKILISTYVDLCGLMALLFSSHQMLVIVNRVVLEEYFLDESITAVTDTLDKLNILNTLLSKNIAVRGFLGKALILCRKCHNERE